MAERGRRAYFFGYSPVRAVRVSGHSMAPTLNWGDWVLFRRYRLSLGYRVSVSSGEENVLADRDQARSLRALDKSLNQKIVLIARLGPNGERDLMQIKRVMRVEPLPNNEIGLWVEGDNAAQSSDSRHWGHVKADEIIGVYLARYHLG